MKLKASDFKKRTDLENEVRNKFGLTPSLKTHTIEGTKDELARLSLSNKSTFWGIKCIATEDKKTSEKEEKTTKIDRGPLKPFGINGKLRKVPEAKPVKAKKVSIIKRKTAKKKK